MGMTDIHGPFHRVNASIKATMATVLMNCAGYNSVMMMHTRSAGSGYATVRLRKFVAGAGPGGIGTYSDLVVHPAPSGNSDWGLNVRTAAAPSSAASVFRGKTPQVGLAFAYSTGTHTLDAMFFNS